MQDIFLIVALSIISLIFLVREIISYKRTARLQKDTLSVAYAILKANQDHYRRSLLNSYSILILTLEQAEKQEAFEQCAILNRLIIETKQMIDEHGKASK